MPCCGNEGEAGPGQDWGRTGAGPGQDRGTGALLLVLRCRALGYRFAASRAGSLAVGRRRMCHVDLVDTFVKQNGSTDVSTDFYLIELHIFV